MEAEFDGEGLEEVSLETWLDQGKEGGEVGGCRVVNELGEECLTGGRSEGVDLRTEVLDDFVFGKRGGRNSRWVEERRSNGVV